MNTFTARIDAFGLLLWLPPMSSLAASSILKQDIAEVLARAKSAEDALALLDIHGFNLLLRVNHHGAQTYTQWSLQPRRETWAAARIAEAA